MRHNCGTPSPNGCGQWHHIMWGPHSWYGSFEVQWPIEHFLMLHKRQAEPSMTQLMKNHQSSPQWQWKEEANFFFRTRFPLPGDVELGPKSNGRISVFFEVPRWTSPGRTGARDAQDNFLPGGKPLGRGSAGQGSQRVMLDTQVLRPPFRRSIGGICTQIYIYIWYIWYMYMYRYILHGCKCILPTNHTPLTAQRPFVGPKFGTASVVICYSWVKIGDPNGL